MHANTNSDYDSHKFPANVSIVQKQHSNTWLVTERKKIREKTQVSGLCCPCYCQQFWSLESLSESPLFPPWSSANVYVSMGILCVGGQWSWVVTLGRTYLHIHNWASTAYKPARKYPGNAEFTVRVEQIVFKKTTTNPTKWWSWDQNSGRQVGLWERNMW